MKAYLHNQMGNASEAKEIVKRLAKVKDIYLQLFELGIGYESIMRRGVELPMLKEFLRPNR